jgi:hypothetical protein
MRQHKDLRKPTMLALITLLVLVAAITEMPGFTTQGVSMWRQTTQSPNQDEVVVLADKRPEHSVGYSSTAQLKLASRKGRYRIGDLMSLDTALINVSDKPLFLRELSAVRFSVRDNKRNEVEVVKYVQTSLDVTLDSFQLVQPGDMITDTIQILLGCNKQVFENIKLMQDAKDDRKTFDQSLFVSWGHACLDIKPCGNL